MFMYSIIIYNMYMNIFMNNNIIMFPAAYGGRRSPTGGAHGRGPARRGHLIINSMIIDIKKI